MDHQRYKITDRVDTGGMAEVFRGVAESTVGGLKRNVAIKRILPSLTKNKKFVAMFLDEARLCMHLQHANIVQVTDIGIGKVGGDSESYFLVMEYVDGVNLKGVLDYQRRLGQRLPVGQTVYILMEVCRALAYAHELFDPETKQPLNIVHRDISPPNILISRRGEVKLVDFGLAKATSQLEGTDPGVVKGKFSYLSPEAAQAQEVDRRADIFAVGILLYEMLTNRRLFDGESDYQTVQLVREARVPPIVPPIDGELEKIVHMALARDPAQRYQRADDLGDALAGYLFSKGQKVTSKDIERLVRDSLEERRTSRPPKPSSLIDVMIQEEIQRFTSLEGIDGQGEPDESAPGELGQTPLNPDQFVNTQDWASELDTAAPDKDPQPVKSQSSDPTRKDDSDFQPLEKMLEGTGTRNVPLPDERISNLKWIVLAVLLVVVAGALIFYLS